jgi:two-component system, cell cycle sensor histidine kinase and response regulator CckA
VNPRVLQIFGLTEAEGLGHGWIMRVHAEDVDAVVAAWGKALREGREYAHEYRLRLPSGEIRWVHCRAAPTLDATGAVVGTVGTIEDTTERRALEDRLRQAQKMEAVGQLAGGVAHDFNNLLTVIQSYGTFIASELPEGSSLHVDVSEILKAARRATDLTRQLLAFGRKQMLQPRRLDLNQRVSNVAGMLRRVIGEDIALETQLAGTLWPVSADPGQLEQVLMNLAVNARDAMPTGGTLRLRTQNVEIDAAAARERPGLKPGAYASIVVEDTGCGIDAASLPHIFEPFFTTKGPGRGTGLGLATVYGIVKQSDGYISVDSTLGEGTRFAVLLPRADAPTPEPSVAPAPAPRGTETILLVEDEVAVRAVIRRMLESLGYTVREAVDGRDALRLAAEHTGHIDLLLTDVVMPELNGRALAEQLADRWPHLRVLFMSGYTDDEILRRGLMQSGSSFLEKPFTRERVAGAVRLALDGTTAVQGAEV